MAREARSSGLTKSLLALVDEAQHAAHCLLWGATGASLKPPDPQTTVKGTNGPGAGML